MKRILCLLLVIVPGVLCAQVRQTLAIDQKKSSITWTGHAEVGTYAPSGGLTVRNGEISLEDGKFLNANLVIDMNSMTQSNPGLLHHLKSADFFDVERYPTATIKIDRIVNGTVIGSMTLKDKSAPIQAPVKLTQTEGHIVITGKAVLDRTQYGIVYNSASFFSSLGNNAISNVFEVEFSLTSAGDVPAKFRP